MNLPKPFHKIRYAADTDNQSHPIWEATKTIGLRFFLPLAVFVPADIRAEQFAETLGYQGSPTQFFRISAFVVLAIILFSTVRQKQP